MSYPKIIKEEIAEGDRRLSASMIRLENALLVLFDEQGQARLGTLAVALPSQLEVREPSVSSVLLGDRNMILTKLLAERLASAFGRMVLVSTHFEEIRDIGVSRLLLKLAGKLAEKAGKTERSRA